VADAFVGRLASVPALRRALPGVAIVLALGIAALVRPVRPLLALVLLIAYLGERRGPGRAGAVTSAVAGALPVAAILTWGALGQPAADPAGSQCTDLFAPPAMWRFLEAAVGLAVLAALVVDRRAAWAELGLRRGSRRIEVLSVVGLLVVVPLALAIGSLLGSTVLGGSFFGTFDLDLSRPAAFAPALVFAASNAVAEELAYRGSLRVWLGPSLGIVGANLGQAIVFGLAHTGADFVGPVAPTAAAMVLAGFIAGVIGRRTGSLTLLIAVHAAFDVPIYFYWACRVA
jgi:membrane protease YdiL (CAAX protease family)